MANDELLEIDLVQLKGIIDRLFTHIINTHGVRTIEIEQSNYWNIPSPEIYNSEKPTDELDIGSLSDDWEFLSSLLDADNQPSAYQLTELASLVRYIGERLGMKLAKNGG